MFSSCCRCVSKKPIKQDDSDSETLKIGDEDGSKKEFSDEHTIKFTGIGYEEGKKVRLPLDASSSDRIQTLVASLDEKLELQQDDYDDAASDETALVHKSTDDIDKLATTTNTTASMSSIDNCKMNEEKLSQNNEKNTGSDETTTSSTSANTVVEGDAKVKSNATSFDNDEQPPTQDEETESADDEGDSMVHVIEDNTVVEKIDEPEIPHSVVDPNLPEDECEAAVVVVVDDETCLVVGEEQVVIAEKEEQKQPAESDSTETKYEVNEEYDTDEPKERPAEEQENDEINVSVAVQDDKPPKSPPLENEPTNEVESTQRLASPPVEPVPENGDTEPTISESDVPPNDDDNGFNPQIIDKRASFQSDDLSSSSRTLPESCLSRRCSSRSSIKKRVLYNENPEVIPSPEYINFDDDEVFSDSIEPKLPRGNMCTPYLLKRGSLPGMLALPEWFSDREEGGILEPPTTPIGRDELALRRHRFFSELLTAAQATVEHRVRFDPIGPEEIVVEDCDPNLKPSTSVELEGLIVRLEHIVDRLERAVSAHELEVASKVLDTAKSLRELTGTPSSSKTIDSELNRQLPAVLDDQLPTTLDTVVIAAAAPAKPHKKQHNLKLKIDSTANSINLSHSSFEEDTDHLPTVISQILPQSPPPPDQKTTDICRTMSVNAYQDIMYGPLAKFLELSSQIGGDVATQANFVKLAFDAQLAYVTLASESSAPGQSDIPKLLQPTSDQISNIQNFREKHRTSPFFNHLSAVSESIPALGWVCVTPTPGPHVKEMNDAGQFYTNRVLKDWKDKDSKHVEWARSWVQTLTELQQYIKQHHTTGLVWCKSGPAAKPAAGGAPPPPPPGGMPPPPPVMKFDDMNLGTNDGVERNALFAQINQGSDITKSLKKVTSEMQTHKNPSLRDGPAPYKAPVSVSATPKPFKSVTAPAAVEEKTPVFSRDGKKWMIEYQKNNNNLLVENAEMNNVVYMFRCQNSTLTVKGKLNSIVIDSCKKCSVVFDSLVSSVEFVNCQSSQMQVLGKVPTITIDKSDGCQMYLSKDSLDVEIVSSKSSEMNVMIPKANGEFTEQPIPEQFKTTIKNNNLSTTFVESLG